VFVVRARRGELVDREQRAVYESGRATYELAGARTFKSRGLAGWLTSGQVKFRSEAGQGRRNTHSQSARNPQKVNCSQRELQEGEGRLLLFMCASVFWSSPSFLKLLSRRVEEAGVNAG
jgi:hypothetical protein